MSDSDDGTVPQSADRGMLVTEAVPERKREEMAEATCAEIREIRTE